MADQNTSIVAVTNSGVKFCFNAGRATFIEVKSKIAEKSTANFRRQQRLTLKLIGLAVTSLGAVTLGLSLVFSGIPAMVSVAAFCLIVLGLLLMTSPDAVTFVLDMLLNWLL